MTQPWSHWINSSIPNLYRLWQVLHSDSLARTVWAAAPLDSASTATRLPRRRGLARGRRQAGAGGSRRGAKRETARTRGPVTRRSACRAEAVTSGPRRQPGGTGDCVILAAHRRHRG
jgi:hypothetical protein